MNSLLKYKSRIVVAVLIGGVAASAILVGKCSSNDGEYVNPYNPVPTTKIIVDNATNSTPMITLENYVTPTPLATNTPEPTSTPDLESLYYEVGKEGNLTQVYNSTNDIIEFAKNNKNQEEAEKRFRRLAAGVVDGELKIDAVLGLELACIEHQRGRKATDDEMAILKEENLIDIQKMKEKYTPNIQLYILSDFIRCFY